ncbi:ABC transporter substrate-binding protein [Streptomyces zagrosensis]|uniref:ABC-type transport system substrate-binding protein n=1 Tax=Streptomyces zagrosensis TaxID=1042984 RepID=A0A7W9QDK7_9ACTN|nr:ABC transporter substrate-binding protein [Streptomyces zagrosensis]MBB5938333.1 ABC-type transport system substrate-binding protein [Streptomyces zagrosensis]
MPDPAACRAVLIGTGDYAKAQGVPAVANNLTALADVLTSPGSWGLAREHCRVLAGPSAAQAIDAVRTAAAEATDALLVYVAGHGRCASGGGDLSFVAPDTVEAGPATGPATALAYGALRDAALAGRASHRVMLLDCCFSGLGTDQPAGPAAVADAAQFAGGLLLAAAPSTVAAYAPAGDRYTAFTGELLRVAANGIAYGPESLRLDTVFEHAATALVARGLPRPERRAHEHATAAGRMAFVHNATAAPGSSGATTILRRAPQQEETPQDKAPPVLAPAPSSAPAQGPEQPTSYELSPPAPAAGSPAASLAAPPPAPAVPASPPAAPPHSPPAAHPAQVAPGAAAPPGAFGAPPAAFGSAPPPFGAAPGQSAAPAAPPVIAAPPAPPASPIAPAPPATPASAAPYGAPPAPPYGQAPSYGGVPADPYAVPHPQSGGPDDPLRRRKRVRYISVAVALVVLIATAVTVLVWPDGDSSKDDQVKKPRVSPSASDASDPEEGGESGPSPSAPSYDAATKGVVNASKRTGGTLKFVGTTDADSWDPQRGYYGFMWNFARFYTRQLVTYAAEPGAEQSRLVPDLATSRANVTNGGKTYTYTLRSGLSWQDGTPITSRDIKYGIERAWASDVISGGPTYLVETLDPKGEYKGPYKDKATNKLGLRAIETPDDRTITFKLPQPNRDFEHMLAMPAGSPVPSSEDTREKYALKPFSSGPYKFVSYDPNESLVLVRNEEWRRESDPVRAALPDRITVDLVTSPSMRDNALLSGGYDLDLNAYGIDAATRARAWRDPKLKAQLDNPYTSTIRYAALATNVRPFDNVHCRKAVFYATDKKAIQIAAGGPEQGGELAPHLLPPGVAGSEEGYDPYGTGQSNGAPDLTRARQELKECGKPGGFSTTLTVSEDRPQEEAVAQTLQSSLSRIGIKVKIERLPMAEYFTAIGAPDRVKSKGYGIVLMRWSPDYPTASGLLTPLADGRRITPQGNVNVALLDDPAINKLFDSTRTAADDQQATRTYEQLNRKISDAAVYLPMTYQKSLSWRGTRLTNASTSSAYGGGYDFASLGVAR